MIPWIASALSLVGLFLNTRLQMACWPVWLLANTLWAWHAYHMQEWAALVMWLTFTAFNVYGWVRWEKAAPRVQAPRETTEAP